MESAAAKIEGAGVGIADGPGLSADELTAAAAVGAEGANSSPPIFTHTRRAHANLHETSIDKSEGGGVPCGKVCDPVSVAVIRHCAGGSPRGATWQ